MSKNHKKCDTNVKSCQNAKCGKGKSCQKIQKKPKRHFIRNAIGLGLLGTVTTVTATAVGAWGAWQYIKLDATSRRRHTPEFDNVITANTYCGMVHKQGDDFTLTTAAKTYHVIDKLAIIEKLAKDYRDELAHDKATKHQKVSDYYDFEVCVLAELSEKGKYGYLGHLDYQLNIVGVPD